MFYFQSFIVFVSTFISTTHFELIFICDVRQRSRLIILHMDIQLLQYHLLNDFPTELPWHNCQKSIDHLCDHLFFWILYSVPLITMHLSLCQYHTTLMTAALHSTSQNQVVRILQLCPSFSKTRMFKKVQSMIQFFYPIHFK